MAKEQRKTDCNCRRLMNKKTLRLSGSVALCLFLICALCLAICLAICAHSQEREAIPFKPGEKLTYQVTFWGIRIGEIRMTLKEMTEIENIPVYHLLFDAKSSRYSDRKDIFVRTADLYPIRVDFNINKEGVKIIRREDFDQEKKILTVYEKANGEEMRETIQYETRIMDDVWALYYLRTKELKEGDKFPLQITNAKYTLEVKGKERMEVPAGNFEAYLIISRPPKTKIWLSDDEKKLPLKIQNKILLGSLTLTLVEYMP